ncbi:MAG: hypothetical protein KG003_08945 [Bacteroidetes bacterium]|nr:hypothetical protein [Bacteroidota bacterium]
MLRNLIFISFITLFTVFDASAQKIDGTYLFDKDSFVMRKLPHYIPVFHCREKCQGGLCIIEGKNDRGLYIEGIIDTNGIILLEPKEVSYDLIGTPNNVYVKYSNHVYHEDHEYDIVIFNKNLDTLLILKDNFPRYISTQKYGELFFIPEKTISKYQIQGTFLSIKDTVVTTIYGNEVFYTYKPFNKYKPYNKNYYFPQNLLVRKNNDGSLLFLNMNLDTIFQNKRIVELLPTLDAHFIEKKDGHFELSSCLDPNFVLDTFTSFKIKSYENTMVTINKDKVGAYLVKWTGKYPHNGSYKEHPLLISIPCTFDSIQYYVENYDDYFNVFKKDSVFTYFINGIGEPPNYEMPWLYANIIRKDGSYKQIGVLNQWLSDIEYNNKTRTKNERKK